MFVAYIAVTLVAAASNTFFAVNDFRRAEWVLANMSNVGLPDWSLFPLGALKALGAAGLLVGLALPPLGIAAAAGLVVFFVGAVIAHARAGVGGYQYPGSLLLLAAGSLGLGLVAL